MSRAPFKLKSGNSPLFKQVGSSPAKQKEIYGSIAASAERLGNTEGKHFLERKPTIPMEKHKGGDPNYKPKLKSKPKLKPLGPNKKVNIGVPKGKKTNTKITKGDVLQTILIPQVDLKQTIKVGKHYTNKAIKKGKELYNKTKDYLSSEI